jgi:Predicted integral membrane protein
MRLKTNRIEALTDGIFAIVMTIMIVSLSELLKPGIFAKESDYHLLYVSLWNDFASYAMSFTILGVLWLMHHWQFQHISYIDPPLVFINIAWFMFICLIPFSTMMVGNNPLFFAPVFVFELNILIVFLILYVQWAYVTRKKHLVDPSLDNKSASRQRNVILLPVMIMLLAIALSYGYHLLVK